MLKTGKRSKKDAVIKVLDVLTIVYLILIVFILVGGGFSFSLFGTKVNIHSVRNPLITGGVLLLIRKIIKPEERFSDIPLVKVLTSVTRRIINWSKTSPVLVLALFVGGYAFVMSTVTILRHLSYHSQAFDLAIFDQILWNVTHGNGLYSSLLKHHFLGEHVSPILYLLAPLYWIYADPKILLVLQSCALAAGAIPVYWLARKKLENIPLAVLFSCIYIWYVPLRNVNLFDFHPIALATPLLLFAFFFLDSRKYLAFGGCLLLALACKEEIAFIVFILGVYIAFIQKKRMWGILLSLGSIVIFILDIWVIIPHFREASFGFAHRYSYLGENIPEILSTLVLHPVYVLKHTLIPEKIDYFVKVFGPVGFFSLLSPAHVLLALPTFFQNMLSDFPPQYSIEYQYTAPLTPFVFISAICGAQNFLKWIDAGLKKRSITKFRAIHIVSGVLIILLLFFFREELPTYSLTDRTRMTQTLLESIPPDASVSAQPLYVSHMSHRQGVSLFPEFKDADYIFLDMSSPYKGPMSDMEYFKTVADILEMGKYGVVAYENGLLLFRKGYDASKNAEVPRIQHRDGFYSIDGALLLSHIGRIEGGALAAREERDEKGFLMYGPYFQLPSGTYRFSMTYSTENIEVGKDSGKWDIGFIVEGKTEFVAKGVIRSVTEKPGSIVQEVVVDERYQKAPVEFRAQYSGAGDLIVQKVTMERIE